MPFQNEIFFAVIFTTALVLLLLGIILLVLFNNARQRARQQAALAATKLDYERELRTVENELSEQMLSRFAQELHDNIGNQLTAVHYIVESAKLESQGQSSALMAIELHLGEATEQLRLLSRTLNYDFLINAGLANSVETEVTKLKMLRRFNVQFTYDKGVTGLDKSQELVSFRIFQEIEQNALRHSGAKNFSISLKTEGGFEMKIYDDGKGFDMQTVVNSGKASGMLNIMRRAAMVGLQCQIDSSPGKGSLFILKK